MRIWFVVPVHGREALTKVCLRQLKRTCDTLSTNGTEATAVVIGTGKSLTAASSLGFATVKRDNTQLGRKFNDGYELACSPEYNSEPADYVIPCGSDDWIDWRIVNPVPHRIVCFKQMAIVNEERDQLARILVRYQGGAGIRIIPRLLIETRKLTQDENVWRPAVEHDRRGIDTGTLYGILGTHGRDRIVYRDVHSLQIVDWKSSDQQLNSYARLRGYRRGDTTDPFDVLADVYPAEALEEMHAL